MSQYWFLIVTWRHSEIESHLWKKHKMTSNSPLKIPTPKQPLMTCKKVECKIYILCTLFIPIDVSVSFYARRRLPSGYDNNLKLARRRQFEAEVTVLQNLPVCVHSLQKICVFPHKYAPILTKIERKSRPFAL